MADIRLWNKEVIKGLLEIYKSYTCLWKVKSDEYKNKSLKENAYQVLVEYCKDNGMWDANRDFVVKKIQSLKGSFRKELKKVTYSQRRGKGREEIYKPNLWYYDLLLFTKDQESPTDTTSNIDEQDDDLKFIVEELQQSTSTNNEEQNVDSEKTKILNKNSDYKSPASARKRKPASSQAELLEVCADKIKTDSKELSEFDAVGINTAKKIARMDSLQAIYAESLINSVLRRGLLNKLTEDTNLCDGCNSRVETSSSVLT